MLHAVARTRPELEWWSHDGYTFPKRVQFGGKMTNRQPQQGAARTRGSAAAQPQRGLRSNPGLANSYDSSSRVSPAAEVTESTYATATSSSSATGASITPAGINIWQPKDTNQTNSINTHPQQYPADTWQVSGGLGSSSDQYQRVVTPRRSSQLPQGQPPSIRITEYDAYPTEYPILQNDFLDIQAQHYYVPQHPTTTVSMATYETSIQPMSDMAMPVSPVSRHSQPHSRHVTPLPESSGRKRSFSEVSQERISTTSLNATSPGPYPHIHEQQQQQQQQHQDQPQPGPRKSRTIRRPDAPTNENHKFICDVSPDCVGLVFDRKCEWGKHMDKHDRPYRCPHPSCAKLQGFTYSGGLLRHEREVHNKHGGPKERLMCPHPTCKRHTEKGFTRKENLQEHIRRVHEQRPSDIAPGLDQLDQPASAMSNGLSADELYAAAALNNDTKRRRSFNQDEPPSMTELHELREQVKRLSTENEQKNALILELREDAQVQRRKIDALEQAMQQIQQPLS